MNVLERPLSARSRVFGPALLLALAAGCSKPTPPAQPAEPAKTAEVAKPIAAAAAPEGDRGTTPASREQTDSDGVVRRGSPVSAEPILTMKEVLAHADALSGKTVKVIGKIENVCQKKGCWMEIAGSTPEERIRITAKDYGFFVPQSALGKTAVVEGALKVDTLSIADAQHIEDEKVMNTDRKPKNITAPVKEISVTAAGLEIRSAT